ncbi:MAG: SDR family oxidoreductase [Anaerolineae bacterium]|nr:SDR family oxidoreductase [Anaerolineae bacterium]
MSEWTDRVVMVTGAAGNLGEAVARAFLAVGAHVVLVDRAADRLPERYSALVGDPAHLLVTGVDMTDEDAVRSAVERTLERFGRIDVLANTVGGYRAGTTVDKTPLADWDFMLDLNARSAFLVSRAVVPLMRARGSGKVIHVASRAAMNGGARAAAYSVAKSAVLRLTESLSAELKRAGINVNCVLPGTIDTPQNRASMPEADHRRWVAPEAIADVILFLASDAARAIHGAAIPVYGTS